MKKKIPEVPLNENFLLFIKQKNCTAGLKKGWVIFLKISIVLKLCKCTFIHIKAFKI